MPADGPVQMCPAQPAGLECLFHRFQMIGIAVLQQDLLAAIARGLHALGVRRFVVAGGETSGAVVEVLGVRALEIGPEIDPGVPWTLSSGGEPVALALKSGNFGAPDFFARAVAMLPSPGGAVGGG